MVNASLVTNQGDRLRTAFDSMKDFGPDGVIIFRKLNIEIIGEDNGNVVDVRLVMPVEKIVDTGGTYVFNMKDNEEIEIGIRIREIANILKRITPGDYVTIEVNQGTSHELTIMCKNNSKIFETNVLTHNLPDWDIVSLNGMSSLKYNGSIVLESSMFHSIIGDLVTTGSSTVSIAFNGKTIELKAQTRFTQARVEVGGNQESITVFDLTKDDKPWRVEQFFSIDHLQHISKAKNAGAHLSISIAEDAPGCFFYDTPIGKLCYIVCPKEVVDDDIYPPAKKKKYCIDYGSEGVHEI